MHDIVHGMFMAGDMAQLKRDVFSVRERAECLSLGFCTPTPWPANPRSLDGRPDLVHISTSCIVLATTPSSHLTQSSTTYHTDRHCMHATCTYVQVTIGSTYSSL